MGQKVHPIGFRLGIYRFWDARWFAQGNKYGKLLIEDMIIRRYLKKTFWVDYMLILALQKMITI